ncbi:MAG TPA: hypothetical protein VGB99_06480 [Acidobacteriota bacterium]|jgi:hypothetical protein
MVRSLEDIEALPLPEPLKGMLAGDYADLVRTGSNPPMMVSFPNHAIAGRWTALRMVRLAGAWNSRVFSISEAI